MDKPEPQETVTIDVASHDPLQQTIIKHTFMETHPYQPFQMRRHDIKLSVVGRIVGATAAQIRALQQLDAIRALHTGGQRRIAIVSYLERSPEREKTNGMIRIY
jgi:hypothetical protein